jgi:hypothetical protein
MKNRSRNFIIGILIILGSGLFPVNIMAENLGTDNPLLENTEFQKQYLLQLSGTVMNETFSGAQALLTLMPPAIVSKYNNPYQIVIEGFPQKNSRNSFFWRSEDTEMTAIANEISCRVKQTSVKEVPNYFIYLSPVSVKGYGYAFVEGEKYALKVALPTIVPVTSGRLKLRIHSNTVSGTVWMKGYDPLEKAFVLYSARLYGKPSYHLKPNLEKKLTEAGSGKQ